MNKIKYHVKNILSILVVFIPVVIATILLVFALKGNFDNDFILGSIPVKNVCIFISIIFYITNFISLTSFLIAMHRQKKLERLIIKHLEETNALEKFNMSEQKEEEND